MGRTFVPLCGEGAYETALGTTHRGGTDLGKLKERKGAGRAARPERNYIPPSWSKGKTLKSSYRTVSKELARVLG